MHPAYKYMCFVMPCAEAQEDPSLRRASRDFQEIPRDHRSHSQLQNTGAT